MPATTCDNCHQHIVSDRVGITCNRCNQARYCNEACKAADSDQHKHWCTAYVDARNCPRCTYISDSFKGNGKEKIMLHSGKILTTKGKAAILKSMDREPERFVVVAHAPFEGLIERRSVQGNFRIVVGKVDTIIIQSGGQRDFLNWDRDHTALRMSLGKEPACCVCADESSPRYNCPTCRESVCESCALKLRTMAASQSSAHVPCPTCRCDLWA